MNKISLKFVLSALAFCLLLVACGNKGPLVKPEAQTTKSEAEAKQ
jgi:predicted small lipoprotein YifL